MGHRVKERPDTLNGRGPRARESGQAVAEFALAFPLLLLIVLGVIQISLMFVARAVVEYAAFAAARAEIVGEDPQRAAEMVCSCIAGPSYTQGTGKTFSVPGWGVLPRSESSSIKTSVKVIDPVGDGNGQVTVEVTHRYELVVPVVGLILRPVSPEFQPDDDPTGLFMTFNGSPHFVIKCQYTRPVPWEDELAGVRGHPPIP